MIGTITSIRQDYELTETVKVEGKGKNYRAVIVGVEFDTIRCHKLFEMPVPVREALKFRIGQKIEVSICAASESPDQSSEFPPTQASQTPHRPARLAADH